MVAPKALSWDHPAKGAFEDGILCADFVLA